MANGSITKRTLDSLKPEAKDHFLWDSTLKGFGVKVTPAGRRVFLIQYRMSGRGTPKRYTIGTYGSPWTPAAARDEAERLLIAVRQGKDPQIEKVERGRVAVDLAFASYADRFLELEVKPKWKASYGLVEGILRNHIVPAFRGKTLPAIGRADITAMLDRLPTNQKALRRNVFTILRRLFRWAAFRGDLETNPLDGYEAPAPPESRDRILNDREVALAWLSANKLGYPFGPFFRLLMGTGQRREEVASMSWGELERSGSEWTIPAARTKNGVTTLVHLSPPMIGLLDAIAGGSKWPKKGLVFTTNGKTPVSGFSKAKSRLDKVMLERAQEDASEAGEDPLQVGLEEWRVHDLRRTLATGMQKLGIRFEVTEAVLNHLSGSKAGVAGVYQRHDWKEEKKVALDAWAKHLERLESGAGDLNVVRLRKLA